MPGSTLVRQLAKFALVGGTNTLLSVLLFSLAATAGMPTPAAAALGFAAGAVNGYCWNRRWTFAAADSQRARSRYLAVQFAALGATTGLMWLLTAGPELSERPAYAATLVTATCGVFTANRAWVFRARRPAEA